MKKPPFNLLLSALMSRGVALCIIGCWQHPGNGADMASHFIPKCGGLFVLSSSAVTNGGALPVEFTGEPQRAAGRHAGQHSRQR